MTKKFVYILKSSKDEKHYIGYTSDLSKRLKRHNSGENKSTRCREGLSLVYFEEAPSVARAVEKEKYIKNLGATRFLNTL